VASLVDANILVYRFDPLAPEKQRRAVSPFLAATGVHELPALYQAPYGQVRGT